MVAQLIYPVARGLHDVFAAVWVGGLVIMSFVVLPAMRSAQQQAPRAVPGGADRGSDDRARFGPGAGPAAMLAPLQKRLRAVAAVAIVGVVLTGIVLMRNVAGPAGGIDFGTPYGVVFAVKLILAGAMIVLAVVRSAVQRSIERSAVDRAGGASAPPPDGETPATAGRVRMSMMLLFANTALGIAVLILSGVGSAIGA